MGSKTLLQQNPQVVIWGNELTQVVLYSGHKTVVVVHNLATMFQNKDGFTHFEPFSWFALCITHYEPDCLVYVCICFSAAHCCGAGLASCVVSDFDGGENGQHGSSGTST